MSILKKGLLFILLFSLFFSYLLLASKRIEYLENKEDEKIRNVFINYRE